MRTQSLKIDAVEERVTSQANVKTKLNKNGGSSDMSVPCSPFFLYVIKILFGFMIYTELHEMYMYS